ncbi:hypothetical protein KI387_007892, partial [Taxus chinensis]
KQQAEFLVRNESCGSVNCVGPDNGSNPRRIVHTRLPNSPRQQDMIHSASPPLSPLRQPSSPFEESSDHYRQEYQPPWTLGSHLCMQDFMPSMAEAGCPFQEDSMPSEAVSSHHRYKHCMKVFPSNEGYYAGSPEFGSPRDVNRMDVANHWPEDNYKHPVPPADIVSHQVNIHQPHFSQQQPQLPQQQQQNMHLVHQAAVGYCPPDFFQNPDVASPRRKLAMQPVKYSRPFEPSEQHEAQHLLPEVYEGEKSWHVSYQSSSLSVTPDYEFANTKLQQVKSGSQTMGGSCRIGEGLGRNEMHHIPSAGELDRYSESQKHRQGVWAHDSKYENRLDYSSAQSSVQNHSSHLPCGRNVIQHHCQPSVTGENVGLIGQNISQIHGRFEGNCAFEYPYGRQFAYEARSSSMHLEHPSFNHEQHGSSMQEFQAHSPHSVTKEGLLTQTASTKVDHLPYSIDTVQTDIGYRNRVDKARAWVLQSTNYQRDEIRMPLVAEASGIHAAEEGITNDAGQSSYAQHDCRWLKPDAMYYNPPSADLYKHATCDQFEPSIHVPHNLKHVMIKNPLDSDLVVHLGSTDGESNCCYSSGEEKIQEFACVQKSAENIETLQRFCTSYEKSAFDVHNFPGAYISEDHLHNEIANISKYEGDVPKEFQQDSGSEITKEIQEVKPLTVSPHYQTHSQLGGLTEVVSDTFAHLESNVTISNCACSHTMTSSKVFLPDSLTLPSSLEVLSSALSSSGPPIYDQSPVGSTNFTGPKDLLSEAGRERQFNESEKPSLKTFGRGQLTEKMVSSVEVAKDESLEKETLENRLNDCLEADACRKSGNMKSLGQHPILSASATSSTTKVEGKEALMVSAGEDCTEVEQEGLTLGSNVKDGLPEEKPPEENTLTLEDFGNGSVNKANNNASDPEADDLAQGLQTIKNDDLEEIRELGSGTYGTVYYGKWKGSDVAIKRIKASCFTERPAEMIADFWREACILGQLHHPNVVAFYGVVRDGPDGTLATVTEYMVNGSLKQVLQRKDRTIDRRKRLIIARDAAFGMEYLHEKKIVHFDLKCDNLLVNMKDPHRPICKIGDLGLSKIKHRTLVSGGVRGTLPWMAPELLSEEKGMVTEKKMTEPRVQNVGGSSNGANNAKRPIGSARGSSLKPTFLPREEAILEEEARPMGRRNIATSYEEYMALPREILEAISLAEFIGVNKGRARHGGRSQTPQRDFQHVERKEEEKSFQIETVEQEEIKEQEQEKTKMQHAGKNSLTINDIFMVSNDCMWQQDDEIKSDLQEVLGAKRIRMLRLRDMPFIRRSHRILIRVCNLLEFRNQRQMFGSYYTMITILNLQKSELGLPLTAMNNIVLPFFECIPSWNDKGGRFQLNEGIKSDYDVSLLDLYILIFERELHDYNCFWESTIGVKGKPIMVMDTLSWVPSPISLEDMELQSKGKEEYRAADTLGLRVLGDK